MLKKTYKPVIIWSVLFVIFSCLPAFVLPGLGAVALTALSLNIVSLGMLLIMYYVYKKEYVYYFTGITYEEADKAGSYRRKRYRLCHLKLFAFSRVIILIFTVIFLAMDLSVWAHIAAFATVYICAAIWSVRYKL